MYTRNYNNPTRITKLQYDRPKITITDTLQNDDSIREKLNSYEEVSNIDSIPIHTHVRYITYKDGHPKFCLGGFLIKIHSDYVILSNNTVNWSVQRFYVNKETGDKQFTTFYSIINKNRRNEIQINSQLTELEKKDKEIEQLKAQLNQVQTNAKPSLERSFF
jgi:hypothetical protein